MAWKSRDGADRDRDAREVGASLGALVWAGLLVLALALAGGLAYFIYRVFAGVFAQYGGPEG